jgi:predicted ATPase/class 3 adenylate cyclase/DNA-binding CsgD family transcriptional regulator
MTPLPRGVVTLLLADVEGSTRMWERDSSEARRAMSELDELVNELVVKFDGVRPVEQGEGDSFVAGFALPTDALACAVEIQRRLLDGALRVRVGMHTGEVLVRDGERYDGATIIRAARLRDLAHGGQTLVSSSTRDLVQEALPDGTDLVDLGPHRLKGLDRPERVYQLAHPALPSTFPALRSDIAAPTNLPTRLTTFIGRIGELADVRCLVSTERLVTVTGAGGCGKTRLALEAVSGVAEAFDDGVWFCDLAPLADPAAVAQTLCAAVGARVETYPSDTDAACGRLATANALVVLDNCEHLIAACADLVHELLSRCPNVHVLTTSREPLGVEGEVAWRVPSLPAPDRTSDVDPQTLASFDSVRLFVERAVQSRPNFALTAENVGAIADICSRLDGIPLALELAAARVRVISVEQIAAGLNDRFRLLGRGARTLMPRQQTLEASVGWSHDLLSAQQRVIFRRLAVFAGGFTLEAAENVVSGDGIEGAEVLELLSQLVDRSLVIADDTRFGTRYRMLETIRQFGRERLVDAGEAPELGRGHLTWFGGFVRRTLRELQSGQVSLADALDIVDADEDNIRAACEWAVADGQIEAGLKLASPLASFWGVRTTDTRFRIARGWLSDLLGHSDDLDPKVRAAGFVALAFVGAMINDWPTLVAASTTALPIAREIGPSRVLAQALWIRGCAAMFADDTDDPVVLLEESIAVADQVGDVMTRFRAMGHLCQAHLMWRGDIRRGLSVAERFVASAGPVVDASPQCYLGIAYAGTGRLDDSDDALRIALEAWEAIGNPYWAAIALSILTANAYARGDLDRVRELTQAYSAINEGFENTGVLVYGSAALADVDDGHSHQAEQRLDELEQNKGVGAVLQTRSAQMVGAYVASIRAYARLATEDLDGARAALVGSIGSGLGLVGVGISALTVAAVVERAGGEIVKAESHIEAALQTLGDTGNLAAAIGALAIAGVLRADVGADADAARLLGAASAARERTGVARQLVRVLDLDAETDVVRSRLGEDAFEAAWAAGEALAIEDAIEFALRGRGPRQRPQAGWDALTPTELKVVALVAEGLSNPQIAERLFISKRTVSTHLSHVFVKVGVASRAELAAEATKRATN